MDKLDLSRFRNYGFWLSIAALIPLLLNAFGVDFIPEEYEAIVNAVLAVLVAAGIINNPTTESKWYVDDTVNKTLNKAENEEKIQLMDGESKEE